MNCTIEGCEATHYARTWCKKHYARWTRTGDPELTVNRPPGLTLLESFLWHMPESPPAEGCWEWRSAKNDDGYGVLGFQSRSALGTHVASYRLFVGEVPDDEIVRHSCDNPPCVQPAHLLAGRALDNVDDRVRRGRSAVGERVHTVKLTVDQVREIRDVYLNNELTQTELALQYGVSQPTIGAILLRKSWKHVA